jgi:hypothetical protein
MTGLYDFPRNPILGPDALRIAADAFEAALQSFHEGVCEITATSRATKPHSLQARSR